MQKKRLRKTSDALREADQRAILEYERLLERIKALAQALGTARELTAIFRALREFTSSLFRVTASSFHFTIRFATFALLVTRGPTAKSSTFPNCRPWR